VLIPEEHHLAAPEVERITPERLKGEPIIIPSTHARVEELQAWFHDMEVEPEILCNYSTLAIGEALAREKLGVVFVLVDYENEELHQHMVCQKNRAGARLFGKCIVVEKPVFIRAGKQVP